MPLRVLQPTDPELERLLGDSHGRFARLVAEADARTRPFYRTLFGVELSIEAAIERIVAEIATEGDAAVLRYGECFDGCRLEAEQLRVDADEIEAAWQATDPALCKALELASERIETYQRRLLPCNFGADGNEPLGCRWTPLDRVAGYVPGGAGGALPLCSTVLMNLVPARVAGVPQLVVATPPRRDGSLAPELLAACRAAGVNEVYRVGGVQAIAALACGTASIPRVDKIVGPGNLFVTLAKRAVYGRVDLDMLAGPSEVLVICDRSADPAWVAADLLSQAEHDRLAMAVLLALDGSLDAVQVELERQLADLPEERRAVARQSIDALGLAVPCVERAHAVALSNRFAPEHLELLVERPQELLAGIRHAGAIFVGPWSPEPVGDYLAGPSHTLPTGGTARMWSGIGTDTFLKRSSVIALDQAGLRALAEPAMALARAEGLEAHARSIAIRLGS